MQKLILAYGKNITDYLSFPKTYKEAIKNINYFAIYDFIPGEKKILLKKGKYIEAVSPATILEPIRFICKGEKP